jgi:tripartite-type tricarboxylate transporter receptor subunit TctC
MRTGFQALRCGALAILLHGAIAAAQNYPTGPIRIVVPFPPGGGTDILTRLIGQKLNEAWGQPVVVENRGGANGTIGAAAVAKAPPDGYTMLVVPAGFAVNPSIYKSLPFDTLKDLAPVSLLASNPSVLVVHPSFPPRTVKELVEFLKAHPGEINYASSGNGSPPHMMTELFKLMTGTKINHVPYKGGGPATIAVVAGEVPIYILNPSQAAPHIKSGRVRPLGVTSEKRDPAFPDIPTIAEAGVPGYAMTNWYGLFVPAGTPRPVVNKIQGEVVRILNLAVVKERLAAEGATVVGSTPEQFTAFLKEEIAKDARVVKASGLTATD